MVTFTLPDSPTGSDSFRRTVRWGPDGVPTTETTNTGLKSAMKKSRPSGPLSSVYSRPAFSRPVTRSRPSSPYFSRRWASPPASHVGSSSLCSTDSNRSNRSQSSDSSEDIVWTSQGVTPSDMLSAQQSLDAYRAGTGSNNESDVDLMHTSRRALIDQWEASQSDARAYFSKATKPYSSQCSSVFDHSRAASNWSHPVSSFRRQPATPITPAATTGRRHTHTATTTNNSAWQGPRPVSPRPVSTGASSANALISTFNSCAAQLSQYINSHHSASAGLSTSDRRPSENPRYSGFQYNSGRSRPETSYGDVSEAVGERLGYWLQGVDSDKDQGSESVQSCQSVLSVARLAAFNEQVEPVSYR